MPQFERQPRTRDGEPRNLPWPLDEPELYGVEATWGKVQPLSPVAGVRTVGELELAELAQDGAVLVDSRVPDSRSGLTIPGGVNHPHERVDDWIGHLDRERVHVLFCNGPQCPQSPDALQQLVDKGFPADKLAYYRGGLHDWITLGMPVQSLSG